MLAAFMHARAGAGIPHPRAHITTATVTIRRNQKNEETAPSGAP